MSEPTWGGGEYTPDDVIEAADHTGYTSPSEYVDGANGLEPDPPVDIEPDPVDYADTSE